MTSILKVLLVLGLVGLVAGCASIIRATGATVEVHGVLKKGDGTPVPNVTVAISGAYFDWSFPVIFSFRELQKIKSDSSGRFSCVIPYYGHYRFDIRGMNWEAQEVLRGGMADVGDLRSKEIVVRMK